MKRWTKGEEEFLKICIETKWTHNEIANELNRTISSIEHKAFKLNIYSKKLWTEDEIEFLKIMIDQQWLYKDIANELDRSRDSIEQKCNRLNISNDFKNTLKTTEKYKEELKIKCPTMICLEEYKGKHISLNHKCLICGIVYKCYPSTKLQGHGCKYCMYNSTGGFPIHKEGILYLVYIPKFDLYKFGITSRTVQKRMRDNKLKISDYTLILQLNFVKGIDAVELEAYWKANLKGYLLNTGLLKTGNTETFRY